MNEKNNRHETIKELVRAGLVHSQEELQNLLIQKGFDVTQATLSRDMKALGIVKMHDPAYGYSSQIPYQKHTPTLPLNASASLDGIYSLEFASPLAVIKTHPGFASMTAAIIDAKASETIIGTLAGDDTVILVIREGFSREQVISSLSAVIPGIENKINR